MELELSRSSFNTQMQSMVQKDRSPHRTSFGQDLVYCDCVLADFAYVTHSLHFGPVEFTYAARFVHFGQADIAYCRQRRPACSRVSRWPVLVHANDDWFVHFVGFVQPSVTSFGHSAGRGLPYIPWCGGGAEECAGGVASSFWPEMHL